MSDTNYLLQFTISLLKNWHEHENVFFVCNWRRKCCTKRPQGSYKNG